MSQVRKFQNGGETAAPTKHESSTAKTYKLIINGREINLDQDGLADFRKAGSGQGGMMGNVYADIADALESGHTVKYNSDSNTISGVDFKRVDPKAIFKANENQVWDRRAQRRANRYARNNNLTHQFNSALASIGSINFEKRKEDDTTSSSDTLTSLYSTDPRQFDYNKGEDGTLIWSNGPQNAGNLTALNNFIDMLGMSEEDAKKKYSWTGYDDQIRDLRNWYAGNQNYDWEALRSRIRANKLDDADWDILRYMGFGENQSSSDSDSSTANIPRSYEGSGFNNDALEQAGHYVKKDKDGNVYLYDNDGNVVQDKIYLKGTPWAKGTQWENGAVYKGRFYTNDQIMNQNNEASQAIRSLFDLMNAAQTPEEVRQAALNSTWRIYGMNNETPYETYDSKSTYLKGFNDLFQNGTYYWNDITGNYNLGNNPNTRILSIYGTERNPDGTFKEQYAVSDNNGNAEILDGIEALQNYLNKSGITEYVGYNSYKPLRQYDSVINNGKRYIRMDSPYKIVDKNIDIYRDENGKYYVADSKGGFTELYGNNIMEAIKNGTATHEDLRTGSKRIQNPDQKWWWSSQRKWMEGFDKSNYQPGAYDEFFNYYKKGGKIQKKQFGGLMSSGKHGNINTEASDFKVGQATKAFGTPKELKTSTDRMSKAAGWFDTAGAAATFIPGYGNVVGAVTGLAGSIARFASDAQRDGLDWGDARRLLTNIGLDVLTLIPGAGTAAKAAKIGKAAKSTKILNSVGKILRNTAKPLSVAGAAGGIATAAGAIADNDGEFTSEDFAQLGQGLLGTVGGFKNISRLNKEAKLVKEIVGDIKVGKTLSKEELATLPWWKRQFVKTKQNITSTKNNSANNMSARWLAYRPWKQDELLDAVIKKGNVDLKKLATRKNGELDESKLAALQNILGRRLTEVGVANLRINPWWMNTNQFKMDKSLAGYTSLNKANATRVGRQMLSKMYHSGVTDLNTAKNYIIKNLSSDKQAYWLDLLNNRSKDFEKLFKNLNKTGKNAAQRVKLFDSFKFKQGGKIIKAQPGTKFPYGKFVTDSSSVDPNLFNYQKSGIQFNDSNVDWTKTYGDGTFMNYRQQYLNNWDNTAFKPVIDAYLAQLSKGNNNVDLSNFSKEDFARLTQDQKLGYAHNLYTDAFANYLKSNTPATVLPRGPLTSNTPTLNVPTTELGTPAQIMSREELDAKREENIKTDGSQIAGGQEVGSPVGETKPSKGFNWNPDDLIGLANLGYSVHKNNQMYGVLEDSIKDAGKGLMKEMPTEIYDRYQDHITPVYLEAANAKRQWTPISTDPLLNYSMRQVNEDAAQALLTEGRLKASEQYTNYLDKDLAARRMYADQRRQIADANRATLANIIMQLGQNDAARRLANNQSVQNFVMEFRNKLAQDKTKRDNLIQSYYTTKAQNDYNTAFRNYLSNADGKNYYQLFKEATDKAPNETFEDWLYRTDMNAYNKANEAGIAAAGETRWNGAASALNWFRVPDYPGLVSTTPNNPYGVRIANEKKGGKTPKYMQRHTGQKPDEAIWIQRNKDTAKALEKLHDAVIKLFMKTLF